MSDTLLVSTRKGLFTVARKAKQWEITAVDFLGDNVTLTLTDRRDGRSLRGARSRPLRRQAPPLDGRTVGRRSPRPPIRPSPRATKRTTCGAGRSIGARPESGRSQPGGADEPGVIWCGTLPGGLFRSSDHGQSWDMIRSLWDHPKRKQWMGGGADLPGIHSILRRPAQFQARVDCGLDRRHLVHRGCRRELERCAAKACAPNTRRPSRLTIPSPRTSIVSRNVRAAPQRMWVQHHNGIFVSSDEGESFTEIAGVEPSTFGFPVVVHPREPDTAWFVPEIKDEKRIPREGKLVVTRTRDGGKSFDVLTKGLPQSHAYDIVYRHALALDETRRAARLRLDDRRSLGERGPGRQLGMRDAHAAAGLRGALRLRRHWPTRTI